MWTAVFDSQSPIGMRFHKSVNWEIKSCHNFAIIFLGVPPWGKMWKKNGKIHRSKSTSSGTSSYIILIFNICI